MKRPKQKNKTMRSFTLLELLIVLVIIAVLAALAIPQYRKIIARGRAAEAVSTIGTIKGSAIRYYAQYEDIPDAVDVRTTSLDVDIPAAAIFKYAISGSNPETDLKITATPNDNAGAIVNDYIKNVQYDVSVSNEVVINYK